MPWNYTTEAIKRLDNEDKRSHFINNLDAVYQEHKYDSKKLYFKLTDLVVGYDKN